MSYKNIIQAVWKKSEKGKGLDKNQAEEEGNISHLEGMKTLQLAIAYIEQ